MSLLNHKKHPYSLRISGNMTPLVSRKSPKGVFGCFPARACVYMYSQFCQNKCSDIKDKPLHRRHRNQETCFFSKSTSDFHHAAFFPCFFRWTWTTCFLILVTHLLLHQTFLFHRHKPAPLVSFSRLHASLLLCSINQSTYLIYKIPSQHTSNIFHI